MLWMGFSFLAHFGLAHFGDKFFFIDDEPLMKPFGE